jgi:hypothetical protein
MTEQEMQFLRDMIENSVTLEQEREHGQAFDKLARGLESVFSKFSGEYQSDKAYKLFLTCLNDDLVWHDIAKRAERIEYFCEEFAYEVVEDDKVRRRFLWFSRNFSNGMSRNNKSVMAKDLADLFLVIRNNRFHGNPQFSGRSFRVALYAGELLEVLRKCLSQQL